jgi:hypothetical protein
MRGATQRMITEILEQEREEEAAFCARQGHESGRSAPETLLGALVIPSALPPDSGPCLPASLCPAGTQKAISSSHSCH